MTAQEASGGTEQTKRENRAAMRVNATGSCQHVALRRQTELAQVRHCGALRPCCSEGHEMRTQGRCTGAQHRGIHVGMAAVIDMADQPRFRPGLQLQAEASLGDRGQRYGLVISRGRRLNSGTHEACTPRRKDAFDRSSIPVSVFTMTSGSSMSTISRQ